MNEEDRNMTIDKETAQTWICEKHGETDAVMQIWTQKGGEHVYCMDCLLESMAAHGLAPLEPVAKVRAEEAKG